MGEPKKINYMNPAQLRQRIKELEHENQFLREQDKRTFERVLEKNHKAAYQVVSRKQCKIEAFICGAIGAVVTFMFLAAVFDLASWI